MEEVEAPVNPALPVAVGLLAPWALVAATFAPRAWWLVTVGGFALLGALLVLAAKFAHGEARRRGLDATRWAVLAVLTLGSALLFLVARRDLPRAGELQVMCSRCGRMCAWTEPFCYACGELS